MPPKHMYFISRNSSMPYLEPSRPMPDSFTPPKDATSTFAGHRIIDVDHVARLFVNPLSVQMTSFAEQPGILQFGSCAFNFCGCILHDRTPHF
jgi:hypothetical protein